MRHLLPLLLSLLCTCARAQEGEVFQRFPLPDNQTDIHSPADCLGYRLGERFTEYARSTAYFEYLADASPRIQLEEYGETYEKRPLVLLTISAEANTARLEENRTQYLATIERAGSGERADGLVK